MEDAVEVLVGLDDVVDFLVVEVVWGVEEVGTTLFLVMMV